MVKKRTFNPLFLQESPLGDNGSFCYIKRGNSKYVNCYLSKDGWTIICEPTDDPKLNTSMKDVKKLMKLIRV